MELARKAERDGGDNIGPGKWRMVLEPKRKNATDLDNHPQIELVGSADSVYDCALVGANSGIKSLRRAEVANIKSGPHTPVWLTLKSSIARKWVKV